MALAAMCYAFRYADARDAACVNGVLQSNSCDWDRLRSHFEERNATRTWGACSSSDVNKTWLLQRVAGAENLVDHKDFDDGSLTAGLLRVECQIYHQTLTNHSQASPNTLLPMRIELSEPPPRPVAQHECITSWLQEVPVANALSEGDQWHRKGRPTSGGDQASDLTTSRMVSALVDRWLLPFSGGINYSLLESANESLLHRKVKSTDELGLARSLRSCFRIVVISREVYVQLLINQTISRETCGNAQATSAQSRLFTALRLLRLSVQSTKKVPDFAMRLCVDDHCKGIDAFGGSPAPIFTMASCETASTIPFIQWNGAGRRDVDLAIWDETLRRRRKWRRELDAQWNCRLPKAVWRGDAHQHFSLNLDWSTLRRLRMRRYHALKWRSQGRLALMYQRCQHGALLNVRIKLLTVGGKYAPHLNFSQDSHDMGEYVNCVHRSSHDTPRRMTLAEQAMRFQMVVHVEGNGGWADRLRHLLLSGMVVLKQELGVLEWFEPLLLPWTHYVPVSSTLHNLSDAVRWVQQHPDEARAMAKAAGEVAERVLSTHGILEYASQLVRRYAHLYQGPVPQPNSNTVKFDCIPASGGAMQMTGSGSGLTQYARPMSCAGVSAHVARDQIQQRLVVDAHTGSSIHPP